MQIAEPLDVALAAAGYAVAQPVFLIDDLAVELVLVAFFFRQQATRPPPASNAEKTAVDLPDLPRSSQAVAREDWRGNAGHG